MNRGNRTEAQDRLNNIRNMTAAMSAMLCALLTDADSIGQPVVNGIYELFHKIETDINDTERLLDN